MKTIFLAAKVILIAAAEGRHLQDAPLSISESSACEGITSVGDLGTGNYLSNTAPCLLTPPDATYSVDLTFDKTVEISYDSFDLEGDSLTFSWTSDQSGTCAGCFTDDGTKLTITSDASIAGLTVNMEVIVSDADHATKYGFTVDVAAIPEEAPVSLEDDDSNDNPRFGITEIGNLGANYFTNAAPCLNDPPEESYDLDLTFITTLVIPFDVFDFEEDSVTFSFTSDHTDCTDCVAIEEDYEGNSSLVINTVVPYVLQFVDSETGNPILDETGNPVTEESSEDIAGQTVTISMIVSDADHATTYTFTVNVAEVPTDQPPLSINENEDECLEWEPDPDYPDIPEEDDCVWPGVSLCEKIVGFEQTGDDFFINAAPCLLFPPEESYTLDLLQNTVTISFESYDFDDDEDELEVEVIIDEEALTLCEGCFAVGDDDLTITADASIAGMSFEISIMLSDENHASIYKFTVEFGEVAEVPRVSGGGMFFMSISDDDGSLCEGISAVEDVEGGVFSNAAPCLLEPPQPLYEIELLKNIKISYEAFDIEENDLTFSWSVDNAILEVCEYCFFDDGGSLTIYAYKDLADKTFDVEIVVEDADHATIYDFQVKILPPPAKTNTTETQDAMNAVAQDFPDLQGYKPEEGKEFKMDDWLSFYGFAYDDFDPTNIEDLQKLPFSVPFPKSMDRFGQVNIGFSKPIDLGSRRLYKGSGESLANKAFFIVELIGEGKDPQPVDFLVNVTETGMDVKVNFTDPLLVQNDGDAFIRIKFVNARYLLKTKDDNRTPDGFELTQKVPKQMVPSEGAAIFDSFVSGAVIVLQIIALAYIVVSIGLKSILIWLWQTINALQLLVLIPLMCKFMPANALMFNEHVRSMLALETIQVFFFGNTILKPDSTLYERLIFAGYKNVALVELLGGFNIIVIVALGGPILWLGFYLYQKLYIRFFKEANEAWLARQGMITKCIGYLLLYNPSISSVQHFVFRALVESYFNIALSLLIYCVSNPFEVQQLPFIYYGLLLTVILILITWFSLWNIFGPQRLYQYHRIDRMNFNNRQSLLTLYQSKVSDPEIEALRDQIKQAGQASFEDQIYSKALVCCAPKLNGQNLKSQAFLHLNFLAQQEQSFGQRNWRIIELQKSELQKFEDFCVVKMSETDTSSRKLGKPLTHGLRKYYHLSLLYWPLFMFRRLALIFIALFVVDYSSLQIICFLLLSLFWMAYICAAQPFWDWNANCFEIFSELCLYVAGLHAVSFQLTDDNPELQAMVGWSYTFCISLHVAISTVFFVGRILTSIVVAIRDRWQSSVAKKLRQQKEIERKAAAAKKASKQKSKVKVTQLEAGTLGEFISAKNLVYDALVVAKQLLGSNRGTIDPFYQNFLGESIRKEHDLEQQIVQAKKEAQQETEFQMAMLRQQRSQIEVERERLQAEETKVQKELEVVLKFKEQKDFEERLNRVQTTLDRSRGVFVPAATVDFVPAATVDQVERQVPEQWKGNDILKKLQAQNRSAEHWDLEAQSFERRNSLDQVPRVNQTQPAENLNTSVMDENVAAGHNELTHVQQSSPKSALRSSRNRKSMSPQSTSPKVSHMEIKYNVESAVSQKAAIRAAKKQQFIEWYKKTNGEDQV